MDVFTISRATDPATSRLAARELTASGNRDRHRLEAYAAVRANPGATARELEAAAGCPDGQIRKRLAELRDAGRIGNGTDRRCRVGGKLSQTWEVVDARSAT